MKKSLLSLAALFALASFSNAAIINWGTSGIVTFDGVTQAGATAHLIFAEASDTGLVDYTILDTRTTSPGPFGAGALSSAAGAAQSIIHGGVIDNTASVAAETNLNGFFIRIYDMSGLYYIDSDIFAYTGTAPQMMTHTAVMNFGTILLPPNVEQSHSSAGWTPVPEPATGALALAGLALLLRRRRV